MEPVVPEEDVKKKTKTHPTPVAPEDSKIEQTGHESWSRAMCLFPDGKRLVSGDYVGRVIVWSAVKEKPSLQSKCWPRVRSINSDDVRRW